MRFQLKKLLYLNKSSIKGRVIAVVISGLTIAFLYLAGARARTPLIILSIICFGNLIACGFIAFHERKNSPDTLSDDSKKSEVEHNNNDNKISL